MISDQFSCVFVYYGLVFIIPHTLTLINAENEENSTSDDIASLYWVALAELPCYFVTWYLADHPWLGRRRTLILDFTSSSAILGLLFLVSLEYLIPIAAFSKFFINQAFILAYQYTLEIYETHNRVAGLGLCSATGRIAGIDASGLLTYG